MCEGQAEALVAASLGRDLGPLGRNPIFVAGHSRSSQATHWNFGCCIRKKQPVVRRKAFQRKVCLSLVKEAGLPRPWEQTAAVSTRRGRACRLIFEARPVCLKAWFESGGRESLAVLGH